jgi:hypothetical protein
LATIILNHPILILAEILRLLVISRGVATAVSAVSMIRGPQATGAPTCVSKISSNVIHKLVQVSADLYVMASQCEIAKDRNPDRIERIQSFKGRACILAQLCNDLNTLLFPPNI